MEYKENTYGLSEGVFKACQFLGLEFPSKAVDKSQPVPSDYFGDDFELSDEIKEKLKAELKWSDERFAKVYRKFTGKFLIQKCLKHTKTDLNVYFCDQVLFAARQNGTVAKNYFHFAFYNKSFAERSTFFTHKHYLLRQIICNNHDIGLLLHNKAKTDKFFSEFIHRDFFNSCEGTFREFKAFVKKHPRFFSKPVDGGSGRAAQIIQVEPNQNLKELFRELVAGKSLAEEVIVQHEKLSSFCPDTTNTLRIATFFDIHNVVHILTASGRFGRMGTAIDNFTRGGCSVIVDPQTGIVTSDGMNNAHEFFKEHPDTGKKFKGFQYPCWDKVRATVIKMAKLIPQVRHIGWDITINNKGEAVLVEANENADVNIQQAPDDTGRLYLYKPLLEEMQNYKKEQMRLLGYLINEIGDFNSAYNANLLRTHSRLKLATDKLIPDCSSLIDLGCRKTKLLKTVCPEGVQYYPVDFHQYDDEIIACDFNRGEFPAIKADTCLCAFTAEYVELLAQFLTNMCHATNKQILMWCRPVDKELNAKYRWENPFLSDFTEEFLIRTMRENHFELNAQYPDVKYPSMILYDFRKKS